MGFEISQIKNPYLKDIAKIVDANNDGTISNGSEVSIFINKSKSIKDNGLCTEDEYIDILSFCPRELETKDGTIIVGNKEPIVNTEAKKQYLEDLNKQINDILKEKSLENTPENIKKATNILKQRIEVEIQIKIQEAKIEKLQRKQPEKNFAKRKMVITALSATGGGLSGAMAGAVAGLKFGAFAGPAGILVGAFTGGLIGSIGAGIAGLEFAKGTYSQEDLENERTEDKKMLEKEVETLNKLKEEYKNI